MRYHLVIVAILLCLAACSGGEVPGVTADTAYINGRIYTVDDDQSWVEAVAVKDGAFLVVGSADDIASVTGDATTVVDLEGRMMMPGLIDSHNHMLQIPVDRINVSFSDPEDADSMIAEIEAFAEANPDAPYIRGGSWNLGVFPGNSPRKELLDAIDSERPMYFYSQTGHSAWVNSATIELTGLTNREQDSRHIWDVDPDTGEPSGIVREWAMGLVEQALKPPAPEQLAPALTELVAQFNEYGFTALKDAGSEVWLVQAANQLDNDGKLDIRVFPAWFHQGHMTAMTEQRSREVAADWESYVSPLVYPRYVKMYADGSSASYSSLLLDDYTDRPGFKGEMPFPISKYTDDFAHFNSLGLGMMVHVYGDGSSENIIEAFEEVRRRNGDNGAPLHFSHSFMTTPDQIERLAKIPDASMDFMTLQYPHDAVRGNFQPSIGEERYQQWLSVRSAVATGIPYGFGSDWPASVEPVLNGFFQMQGFVTREDPNNSNSGTLNPEQAITLEQAVYGFTMGGAHNLGFDWPEKVGSIEEGKLADFIVIDRNIFEIPIETLKDTQVELTVVGGRVVFDRDVEVAKLDVVTVEITNPDLQNAVDAAELNLLVDEAIEGGHGCFHHDDDIQPGSPSAPAEVNQAFAALAGQGHHFARTAREIYWKNTDTNYWIQWTVADDAAVLWAFDPVANQAVEVLRVRE